VLPLVDLFMPDEEVLAASIKEALAKKHLSLTTGASLPAVGAGAIAESLAGHVRALFPNDVGQLFLGAWNNSVTLRQYLEKSAQSPGKEIFLQLSEHKIESTHQPYVALMKDGAEIARVPFEASIELLLQGVVLRLRDGAVQDIQTGRVKGKAVLKCFGAVVLRKEIDPTAVPGTIRIQGTRAAEWLQARPVRRAS
jgi:hypothetical protein